MAERFPSSKYQYVPRVQEATAENEIRVKAQTRPFVYAAYCGKLLFEKKHDVIKMQATGPATSRVIQSVEYIRHRVPELHVAYDISSLEFTDEYQPLEEGLEVVKKVRIVPVLTALLSFSKGKDLVNKPGYLAPVPAAQIIEEEKFKELVKEQANREKPVRDPNAPVQRRNNFRSQRGRGRGRGREQNEVNAREEGRGRGYQGERRDNRVDRDDRDRRAGGHQRDNAEHRPQREQGEFRERGQRREQGDYRPPREQGDYRGPRRDQGDYRGPRRDQGEQREPREQGNYRQPREQGDYRQPREQGDYRGPRRDQGEYNDQQREPRGRYRGNNAERNDYRGEGQDSRPARGYQSDYRRENNNEERPYKGRAQQHNMRGGNESRN